METNKLKILAGNIVTGSKMSKSAKLQLLNWLQNEATEVQIKALLLDGEMIIDLDEQAEEIVNARFEVHPLNELKRVPNPVMKKKVEMAKAKCAKVKDRKERTECIQKYLMNK